MSARIHPTAYIAPTAAVMGNVTLEEDSSVWYGAVVRGDLAPIVIGAQTNLQDGTIVHVDEGVPCTIGRRVGVGHRAILHGCTVEDECLIGMGAIVLSGAVIGRECIVGAGALVTEGKTFPPRSLILGSPAKAVRTLDDAAVEKVRENGKVYVRLAAEAAHACREVPWPGSAKSG